MASEGWFRVVGWGNWYLFTVVVAHPSGYDRLVGELMRWMDLGELGGSEISEILPGGYAVLGAAAMAAGVTRTVPL